MEKVKCQILKPYFIDADNTGVGIKDYIEVNSALALALQGLGEGVKGVNFKELALAEKINLPSIELPSWISDRLDNFSGQRITLGLGFNKQLDSMEKSMLRLSGGLLSVIVLYSGFSYVLANEIKTKEESALNTATDIKKQISLANADLEKIRTRTSEYNTRITNLQETSNAITEKNKNRNSIPNLLNRIMFTVPKNVQITSIKNT